MGVELLGANRIEDEFKKIQYRITIEQYEGRTFLLNGEDLGYVENGGLTLFDEEKNLTKRITWTDSVVILDPVEVVEWRKSHS
jgi:hypothetical protein